MLKVQEFLQNNTLQDLALRYNIQYEISNSLGVVAFNYSNLSPMNEPLVKECRGLFLELDTWNLVCKSMSAFCENFDLQGQVDELTINWEKAKLIEKLDGALIVLYFYKDEWRIGMRMSADGSNKAMAINGVYTDLTFAELTKLTVEDMGYSWAEYISQLDSNYFYSFELCAPETRYGVIYTKRTLTLLSVLDKITLEEIDIYTLEFPKEKPIFYKVNNMNEVFNIINEYSDPIKYEGFVLYDGTIRIKYKNPEYILMLSEYEDNSELQSIENLLYYVLSFSTTPGGGDGYSSSPIDPLNAPFSISNSGDGTPWTLTDLTGTSEQLDVSKDGTPWSSVLN